MHLHRHTFEISRVGKKEMSGLFKDVVNVMPLDSVAVDFVADNPGGHAHALPPAAAQGFWIYATDPLHGLKARIGLRN
jgi:hypothetical protein